MRHFIQPMRQCGAADPADARSRRSPALGRRLSPMFRRRTTRSSTKLPGASSAMASLPPQPALCRLRPTIRSSSKTHQPSAISARAMSRSSISSTSPPGARSMASTPSCPALNYAVVARPPVHRREARLVQRRRRDEGPRRREDRHHRRHAAARQRSSLSAGSRSSRATPGPRSKDATRSKCTWDDGPHARPTTRRPTRRSSKRPRAKPGKVVRNDGDAEKALADRPPRSSRQNTTSRIIAACADGAAQRDSAHRRRQMRGLGPDAEPRERPAY